MPKVPTAPITPPLLAPHDADNKQDVERLTRKDRESLNSFVQNLDRGISFDKHGRRLEGVVDEPLLICGLDHDPAAGNGPAVRWR